jgi:hypothetical protein
LTHSDGWFAALDECRVGQGAESWIVHVSGIWNDGRDNWIQIHEASNPDHSLVLRVGSRATPDDVIATLASTPRAPFTGPEVIQIRRRAA